MPTNEKSEKFVCKIHKLYCRCMQVYPCNNRHYSDCLKECQTMEKATSDFPDKLADCPNCGETLLGNVPCWSNLCYKPKIEKCNHDDCLRDGPRPGCWTYQPDKLAEAKKEIEEWERNKGLACSHTKIPYEYTEKLLAATALISYERGREEQKKKDALIVAKVQVGICSRGARSGESFVLDQVRKTILNPSPDAK